MEEDSISRKYNVLCVTKTTATAQSPSLPPLPQSLAGQPASFNCDSKTNLPFPVGLLGFSFYSCWKQTAKSTDRPSSLQILVMLTPPLEAEYQLCPTQVSWLQLQDEFSSLARCSYSYHPLQWQPAPWNVVWLEGRQNWAGKSGSHPRERGSVASVEGEGED